LDGFVRDLVEDLSAQAESAGWSASEIRVLAELYVNHTMLTATAILEATTGQPRLGVDPGSAAEIESRVAAGARQDERAILEAARMQLRLISLGRRHWLREKPATGGEESKASHSAESDGV
jgi:hypothetical protein